MFRKSIKIFYKRWSEWISYDDTVYDFSVDHSSIKKEDILHIHEYLMVKKYKIIFGLIKKMFIGLLINIVNASDHTKCVSLSI